MDAISPDQRPSRNAWDRGDWAALLILTAAAMLTSGMILSQSALTGVWEDDGVYLVTAKSLADGKGYRRLDLPGEPYQTKYPILYPLLLSSIWRLAPGFPGNLPAMQIFNAACGLGAILLAYRLFRRAWNIPAWLAIVGASSAICSPFWVALTQYTMSEHLYTLLSMGALVSLFPRRCEENNGSRSRGNVGLVGGAFAAGALLCRSIGITVIIAVLATWLLRRRWRELLWAALLPSLAAGSWYIWQSNEMTRNAANAKSAALTFDLDYSAWTPRSIASAGRIAWFNSASLAWSVLDNTLQPPPTWLDRAARCDSLRGDFPFAVFAAVAIAGVLLLIIGGLLVLGGGTGWPVHLYILLYGGVVLVWPFRPDRMIVPLLPFLQLALIRGAWGVLRSLAGALGMDSRPRWPESAAQTKSDLTRVDLLWPSAIADRLAMVVGVVIAIHFVQFDYQAIHSPDVPRRHAEREGAVALIREHTEPDAVLASLDRGYFFLVTGRQCVPTLPYDNPVALYYPSDRSFWNGSRRTSRGERNALERDLEERANDYYLATNVRYAIMCDDGGFEARSFGRFCARHLDRFEVVGDAGPYRLWRVRRP